jgi:acyl-[acyl-carrier-protein]-phospholipid O-acyltransferase / long-chain-fatty-acid--[acyl-carrier-protein] ligase
MLSRPRRRIFSSFSFLNVTQFCGALNDNVFKIVIAFMLIGLWGRDQSNLVQATSGFAYVLPFLLFSIPSGTLADRLSKRNITVFTKFLEVGIMLAGVVTFAFQSVWGAYTVLFLMATQSAIFGPSKYGIVPELVRRDQIATANGILTALTVIAAIFGSFFASLISEVTSNNYVIVGWFCVGISVVGLTASLLITKTPALGIKRKLSARMVTGVVKVLKRARGENYLFVSLLGSGYFFLVAAFTQLNILPYGIQSLNLSPQNANYLFTVSALGIAVGAFISGRICGKQVELGISALSGLGVAAFFFALAVFDHNIIVVATALCVLGMFGGMYLVPYDAYIQAVSPDSERGENVAAGSFLSFFGVMLAAILLYLFGNVFGFSAAEGFAWMGVLTVVLSIGMAYRLSDTFVRLASRINFHRGHHIKVVGHELVTARHPSVYITLVDNWEIGLLSMITLQQRYMRFIIERPGHKFTFDEKWLAHFAKVTFYDGAVPAPDGDAFAWGERSLKRGYSLTVITQRPLSHDDRTLMEQRCREMAGELTVTHLESSIATGKPIAAHITPEVFINISPI